MEEKELFCEINGYRIYDKDVKFYIEVSERPNKKSEYKILSVSRIPNQAVLIYNSLNIGNGYKKRLVVIFPNGQKKTIARDFSW